jgi:hypothetical protein
MAETIYTTTDGWDCVPALAEAVRCIDDISHDIYEINRCQRESDLGDIVRSMRDALEEALNWLDAVDTECEYITKEQ